MLNSLYTVILIALSTSIFAQVTPSIEWQKNIGGNGPDLELISTQNFLGDIFIAGYTYSSDAFMPANHGGADIYVSKLSDKGLKIWSRGFGGSVDDFVADIAPTSDGGIIMLCYINSTDHDFAGGNPAGVWLIKLNNDGSTAFKIFYGGNPAGIGKIRQTASGGFIFNSTISANNGTLGSNGLLDLWVVRTGSLGNITWQKNFGGTSNEYAKDILELNGDFYVLGESESPEVNGKGTNGDFDVLVLRIDQNGNTTWTKLYGGADEDKATGLAFYNDGIEDRFFILASSKSSNGDIFLPNNGGIDFWIFDIDTNGGTFGYNYTLGGPKDDIPSGIFYNESTSKAIVTGSTRSDWLPPEESEPDTMNILVAELIPFGGEQWKLILGGSLDEQSRSILPTLDGGILISGHSFSNDGDLTGNIGDADFWLIKLNYPCPDEINADGSTVTKSVSLRAENYIKSNSSFEGVPSKVKMQSNYIQLDPGFKIEPGVVFETVIGGCAD